MTEKRKFPTTLIAFSIIFIGGVLIAYFVQKKDHLPIYNPSDINPSLVDESVRKLDHGHRIQQFTLINQLGDTITEKNFEGKIYVADFFFTTCPTICPIMKRQMLRVYEKYKDNPDVLILSHTIDPDYDSVEVLHEFADRLGVSSKTWHFVTGNKDSIYDIGQNSYMVTARQDPDEPGGYLHSGAFLLIDKDRRVRGIYDGTIEEKVDVLMKDMDKFLKEYPGE